MTPESNNRGILDYDSPRHGRRRSPVYVALAAASLLLLGLVAIPILLRRGPIAESPRMYSQSNLRQIGQYCLLYSNNFQGEYPDNLERLLLDEDMPSSILVARASNDVAATGPTTQGVADQLTSPGHCSYIYLGSGLTERQLTADTIVAFERQSFDGSGGINVLVGDGHVDFEPALWATQLTAKLAQRSSASRGPVTMPVSAK